MMLSLAGMDGEESFDPAMLGSADKVCFSRLCVAENASCWRG